MLKNITLRSYLLWSMGVLASGVVLLLSYQSAQGFLYGFDAVHHRTMRYVALSEHPASDEVLEDALKYKIASRYEQLPAKIKQYFPQPIQDDKFYKKFEDWWYFAPPKNIYLLLANTNEKGLRKFVYLMVENPKTKAQGQNERRFYHDPMAQIALLGLIAIIIFVVLAVWIMRKVATPFERLDGWARRLNLNYVPDESPEFKFKELTSLAKVIHHSFTEANDSLRRENDFLKYASHELRTPIATMRSNIELLNKVSPEASERELIIRSRMQRAISAMRGITETLLWLSRESEQLIPEQQVDVAELIDEIRTELNYLLVDKPVILDINTEAFLLELPVDALRILLQNLIRNAFQHCNEGTIKIKQSQSEIIIRNTLCDDGESNDVSFGLGLKLSKQIVERFNWRLDSQNIAGMHEVRLTLNSKI